MGGCTPSKTVDALTSVDVTAVFRFADRGAIKEGRQLARNVFAKPLPDIVQTPVNPKTQDGKAFLETALPKCFVFEDLNKKELGMLVDAMELVSFAQNETIIKQGDAGDFFYVIYSGTVDFIVDGNKVGEGKAQDAFGELALLYTTPRAATVIATSPATLYRVDQAVFRFILQQETKGIASSRDEILKQVKFLADLDDYSLHRLADVMTVKQYSAGAIIVTKGDKIADHFYILQSGSVRGTEIEVGGTKYEDVTMNKAGDYFGERALLTGEPRAATVTAVTDTVCLTIDRQTFESVLGEFKTAILKANDKVKLSAIKVIADSKLSPQSLAALATAMEDTTYAPSATIFQANKSTSAALYFVRKGSVVLTDQNKTLTIGSGGYFGEDQLKADLGAVRLSVGSAAVTTPKSTAVAGSDGATCGVLTLSSCRQIMDTRKIGTPQTEPTTSFDKTVKLEELKWHTVLGAGTFGQVWLVSKTDASGKTTAYAMKVQSKSELLESGQAKAVAQERDIMAALDHPFLLNLICTYQDKNCLYIMTQLVLGGELYTHIHTKTSDHISEKETIFYSACIAEGLGFMHRRGYVYRDLKPENVMIDEAGYCVIIDFGFAKYVPAPTKTYTLCGTPLYLAPEVILNRGHNGGADHWCLGVMIYEMLTGGNPFYKHDMDQVQLFTAIVKAQFEIPSSVSPVSNLLIQAFLQRNPSRRIGSLAKGEDDILEHPFFATIDFDKLRRKKIEPPMKPKIRNPLDTSNFDDWSHLQDKRKTKYPKLSENEQSIFADF